MMINPIRSIYKFLPLAILISVISFSCKDDAIEPQQNAPVPVDAAIADNEYVNNWILENMKFWYLWNDQLPTQVNKGADPATFFTSLKNKDDRFSLIQSNYVELLNSLSGISKEAGYEFVLYRESTSGSSVVAQVLYVKPNSPATNAGLLRGDLITHINNNKITTENYRSLLQQIKDNHSITYKPLLVDEEAFGAEKSVSLTTVEYTENPNYLSKVIATKNKKIGYYVYNFFASGIDNQQKKYDDEMDAVFAEFKSQGITDLIIDFRFNSGGAETASKNLASLIGADINSSLVFAKRKYNDNVNQQILNDASLGEAFLSSKFVDKSQNIGNQLEGKTVYILTSSRTASASELVINALKPYMNVVLVGNVTYGKNVGSISLYEKDKPKNTWGLQPIVVKSFNSLDQSDYSMGFIPDLENKDNSLYLYPLGDERETMLAQTIARITGSASLGRTGDALKETRELIGHSLDEKRRSFMLTFSDEVNSLE